MGDGKLKRTLKLHEIIFFGLGITLGAGIYALVGKVIGLAGVFAPLSFLLAALIALFTGLSYAELSARIPKSGGEVNYIYNAFSNKALATIIGLLIVLTGIVSTATISNGFYGYLTVFFGQFPKYYAILGLLSAFAIIAIIGIKASILVVTAITVLEVLGILLIIWIGFSNEQTFTFYWSMNNEHINAIILASFITFYAFIGFEDMVNLAEETQNSKKVLPKALIIVIAISALLYILVSIATLMALPVEQLETSAAPFADIIVNAGYSPTLITAISLIAVSNGALVQIIMASRVLYGLSQKKFIPHIIGSVNSRTGTPIVAIIGISIIAMILGMLWHTHHLAITTSAILLVVFTLVNIALIRIKNKEALSNGKIHIYTGFKTHNLVPYFGFTLCIFMLLYSFLY